MPVVQIIPLRYQMLRYGLLAGCLLLNTPCDAQESAGAHGPDITIIAITGDPLPVGAGAFAFFEDARINVMGQVSFSAGLTGTPGSLDDNSAIYLYDPVSGIHELLREGEPVPGGGELSTLGSPTVDGAGRVVVSALLNNTPGGSSDNSGLFASAPGSGVLTLAREGDAAPDGNGNLQFIEGAGASAVGPVAFFTDLENTAGGFLDDEAVLVWAPSGTLTQIARAGDDPPSGAGPYGSFGIPRVSSTGAAAFFADLRGVSEDKLIVRWSQSGSTVVLAEGEPSPDANGQYASFGDPAIGHDETVVAIATLRETAAGADDNQALLLVSESASVIAREGDPSPDGNGSFASFSDPAASSDSVAAFNALLRDTSEGTADDRAVYAWHSGVLTRLFREGDVAPGHSVVLTGFSAPIASPNAQVAVIASIDQSGVPGSAILIGRGDSEREVLIATGDALAGSSITALRLASDQVLGSGFAGLDRLAFTFELADGRSGIATVRTPPSCPADLDQDRILTFTDITQFLTLFSAGDSGADFEPDGILNFSDVVAFLVAFSTPCKN